jgi:hypothetical protein
MNETLEKQIKEIRMTEEEAIQLSTICRQLKMESSDGKFYETDCANTEGIFRIIQSIPSKKAGPFKRWLAKNGFIETFHKIINFNKNKK